MTIVYIWLHCMSHLSHLYVPHNRMYEDKDTGGAGTGIEDGTNDIWDIWEARCC